MIWSTWNQGLGAFDYFDDGRPQQRLNVEKPSHLVSRTLGSTVDQAAWPLPPHARHIGSGPHAVGRVAVRKGIGVAVGDVSDSSLVKAGLLVASAVLLWKYVVKSPARRTA